jgi:hypothetical protein
VLELIGEALVEQYAEAERAEHVRDVEADRNGDRHHLQNAARVRPEFEHFVPGERARDRGRRGIAAGVAASSQHSAVAARDQQQIGTDLLAIVLDDRRDRRRVLCIDGALQLGQVGEQPREDDIAGHQGALLLCHLRCGIGEAARQFRLRLVRGARADDVHGDAGRGDGQQRAGEKMRFVRDENRVIAGESPPRRRGCPASR